MSRRLETPKECCVRLPPHLWRWPCVYAACTAFSRWPLHRETALAGALLVAALTSASGCSRNRIHGTENLMITPGVGISSLVEVGMPLRQVRRNTGRVIEDGYGSAMVPPLGLVMHVEGQEKIVVNLHFFFDTSHCASSSPVRCLTPFRGHLAPRLSFSSGRSVSYEDVLFEFGQPHCIVDDYSRKSTSLIKACIREGHPAQWNDHVYHRVYYPVAGIMVTFVGGEAKDVWIPLRAFWRAFGQEPDISEQPEDREVP